MKVLASLRKQTKTGVSTWTFIHDAEMKVFYTVGGADLKVIKADNKKHLGEIYQSFIRYGYTRTLPKKQYISDPWASKLPSSMQMELEALSVA